jgi:hypothetical protein
MKYKVGDRFEDKGEGIGFAIYSRRTGSDFPYYIEFTDGGRDQVKDNFIDSYTKIGETKMKYKVGDRLEDKGAGIEFAIYEVKIGSHFPYLIEFTDGGIQEATDADIDSYTKIEDPLNVVWDDTPAETDVDEFSSIMKSFGDMLNEKNSRYGDAALKPLSIVGKHHRLGVKVDEKLSRIRNSDDLKKNDVADTIGYLFLICKDMGWEDFSDQLD